MDNFEFIFYKDYSDINEEDFYWDWEQSLEYACDGEDAAGLASMLVSFANRFGLTGNLWQQWIAYVLMMHENPLSLACERREVEPGSTMMKLAKKDFENFIELLKTDISSIGGSEEREIIALLSDYSAVYKDAKQSRTGKQIAALSEKLLKAADVNDFAEIITDYYKLRGAGKFGMYRAFRIAEEDEEMKILPIEDRDEVSFDQLVGYEEQKEVLKENTEAFIRGVPANNALLYGDSGTGKSTSIHALMHEYADEGLRLVEVSKAERSRLPEVMAEIKKRNYKFIIFMDDLSFEEDESDYKELKAMLEGALESREDNVLIYATSNRRHLIRETWRDRNDMEFEQDVHRSDTMEEKLSLASRFGVMIYYGKPDYDEYMTIVRALVKREGLEIDEDELSDEARKWSLRHGSTSGRTASQLIKWLAGRE